jgi:hypothetical protein
MGCRPYPSPQPPPARGGGVAVFEARAILVDPRIEKSPREAGRVGCAEVVSSDVPLSLFRVWRDARRTRPVVAFARGRRRQSYFTLGGGSARGVRHSPDENAEPSAYYPAGCGALCPKTAPRLTLDHITRISKVRCTSKSSHAGTGGSLREAQVGRIDCGRDVDLAAGKERGLWDRETACPRFLRWKVCSWPATALHQCQTCVSVCS